MHDGDGWLVLVAGDDGGDAALARAHALLREDSHVGVRQRLHPLGGLQQTVVQRNLGLPAQHLAGLGRVGIPVSEVPAAALHGAEHGLLRDREQRARALGEFADGRVRARADVEAFAVYVGVHAQRRADERAANVRHVDEVARCAGVDQRGQVAGQCLAQQVRYQAGGVLERPIYRIEPQVDAGKAAVFAEEMQEIRRRTLGNGVVAVGIARPIFQRSGADRAVLR